MPTINNALVPIWETVRRTGVPLSEFEARAYGGDLEVWWRPTSPIPGCFGRWTGEWADDGEPCVVSEPFLVAPEVLQLQLGPFKSLFCMLFPERDEAGQLRAWSGFRLLYPVSMPFGALCVNSLEAQVRGRTPEVVDLGPRSLRELKRMSLGVLRQNEAAELLPLRDSDARSWLAERGLAHRLDGRAVVLTDEIRRELGRRETAAPPPKRTSLPRVPLD